MANPTTNLNITLPVPESESSRGSWGDTINAALQSLDTGIADRGVPSGGADNQVLTKNGSTDYATEWANKSAMLTFLNAEDGATADQSAAEVRTLVADASDSNVYTDAEKTKLTDFNLDDVTTVADNDTNITAVAGQITPTNNIATLSTNLGNINLVGDDLSGTFSSIEDCGAIDEAVSGSSGTSNITTVADNIANVNNFADLYQIDNFSPSAPTTDGGGNAVAPGDLAYDSTANELKFWNGSAFIAIAAGDISGVTAGAGLTGGGTSGTVTVNVIGGTGITANANDIAHTAHTGDVTGATVLTIANDAVTEDKLANTLLAEIDANTAKTGITSGQASAITANTAKVTNSTNASDLASGTVAVARGGTGATAKTGTGNNVLATSPTLVSPVLGVATATSITGGTGSFTTLDADRADIGSTVVDSAIQIGNKVVVYGSSTLASTHPGIVIIDAATGSDARNWGFYNGAGGHGVLSLRTSLLSQDDAPTSSGTNPYGNTVALTISRDGEEVEITGDLSVVGTIGSPTLVTPDLGTPSSMMLDFGSI